MAATGDFARGRPMWAQNQRNSWHGVEFPYHSELNIAEYYKRYAKPFAQSTRASVASLKRWRRAES